MASNFDAGYEVDWLDNCSDDDLGLVMADGGGGGASQDDGFDDYQPFPTLMFRGVSGGSSAWHSPASSPRVTDDCSKVFAAPLPACVLPVLPMVPLTVPGLLVSLQALPSDDEQLDDLDNATPFAKPPRNPLDIPIVPSLDVSAELGERGGTVFLARPSADGTFVPPSPATGEVTKKPAPAKAKGAGGGRRASKKKDAEEDVTEADGDVYASIKKVLLDGSLFAMPLLVTPASREKQVMFSKRRAKAAKKLADKRIAWKAAVTARAATGTPLKYADRSKAANTRKRVGGRFVKEDKGSFRPVTNMRDQ